MGGGVGGGVGGVGVGGVGVGVGVGGGWGQREGCIDHDAGISPCANRMGNTTSRNTSTEKCAY